MRSLALGLEGVENPYYLELPELTFDPKELLKVTEELHYAWKTYASPSAPEAFYEHLRHPRQIKFPYIAELRNRLTFHIDKYRTCFLKFSPHYLLDPHTDTKPPGFSIGRQAAVVFPLTQNHAPIRWHDESGNIVKEHNYSLNHATLINTQVPHSILNNETERISFQFSIYEMFSDCVARYEVGTFFR